MIKKLLYLLISVGLFITMISSCEKDSNKSVNNIDLLTNGSSKIWCLSEIATPGSIAIKPLSCIVDDENKFQINGKCLIDNMGSIINTNPPIFSGPPSCKDTVDIVDTASWTLNTKMDTLTVSTKKYVLIGKIIKLTTDSLIIKRTYDDSYIQFEYYVTKNK
jgi:hypothetical protein